MALQGAHGQYHLLKEIGRGQFSVVYLAKVVASTRPMTTGYEPKQLGEQNSQQYLAAKRVPKAELEKNPKYEQLFVSEKKVMRCINHPNLLGLVDEVETATDYYILTEYLPTGDLSKLLANPPHFIPEPQALFYMKQLLSALKHLHGMKVMHRDLKPDNILMDGHRLVVGDFGFSTIGLLTTGSRVGTPYYMAPEVLFNREGRLYTSKVDLYSLGVVYYQMLFGRVPFPAQTLFELEEMVQTKSGSDLQFPAGFVVSEESKNLLRGLIEKDPIERISWKAFFAHQVFKTERLNSFNPPEEIVTQPIPAGNLSWFDGRSQFSTYKNQLSVKVNQTFEDDKRSALQDPDSSFVEDAGIFRAASVISSKFNFQVHKDSFGFATNEVDSWKAMKAFSVGNQATRVFKGPIEPTPQLTEQEFGSFGSQYPYNQMSPDAGRRPQEVDKLELKFYTAASPTSPKQITAALSGAPLPDGQQANGFREVLDYFHHERNKVRFFMSTAKKGRSLSKNLTVFERYSNLLEAITLSSYVLGLKGARLSNYSLLCLVAKSSAPSSGGSLEIPVRIPSQFESSASGQKLKEALVTDKSASEQYLAHLTSVQTNSRQLEQVSQQELDFELKTSESRLAQETSMCISTGLPADTLDALLEYVGCLALCVREHTALVWKPSVHTDTEDKCFDWAKFQEEGLRGSWRAKGWEIVRAEGEKLNNEGKGCCGVGCGGIARICS